MDGLSHDCNDVHRLILIRYRFSLHICDYLEICGMGLHLLMITGICMD